MEKLVFLGIGSNSFEALNTSSFALKLEEQKWLLVDCGPDTPRQVTKATIPFLDINYIVITHRHLDHSLGLPYFVFGRNLERLARLRQAPNFVPSKLCIVAEREVWDGLWGLFRLAHPDVKSLGFDIEFTEISSFLAAPQNFANVKLQTFEMIHTVPTYGFIIWSDDQKILAYSADTLPSENFIEAASGSKVLIHEAMIPASETAFSNNAKHSTAVQAGDAVAKIHPAQAFLMHLRPAFLNKRSILEKEASEIAGMQVIYPDEGLVVSLK